MELFLYVFLIAFGAYVVGVVVGENKSNRIWRDKWWELREEYMSEYPESFEENEDDDGSESSTGE